MQQEHDAEPRPRPAVRFTRDDDDYGMTEERRSRLVESERQRAAMELFAGQAAHELMEPLIVAETLARSIEEQLEFDRTARHAAISSVWFGRFLECGCWSKRYFSTLARMASRSSGVP